MTQLPVNHKAIRCGWLFFVCFVALMVTGCQQKTSPAMRYDQEQAEQLRDEIDNGEWD